MRIVHRDPAADVGRSLAVDMTQSKLKSKLITTACGQCYIGCGIKVQVENGVLKSSEIGAKSRIKSKGRLLRVAAFSTRPLCVPMNSV